MSQCSFEGCERPVRTRALCGAHYAQWHKNQELKPLRVTESKDGVCLYEGCERRRHGAGYCSTHYKMLEQQVTDLRLRIE